MGMNIDLFDDYASHILADLYENFPVKIMIDAREISGDREADDFGTVIDDQGKPSKRFDVALGTIEWLLDSGYLRSAQNMTAYGLSGAVLTAKGLTILKAVPKSIKATDSFGDRLAAAVRSGTKESARELLKAIFAKGAEMAVAAMP